MLNSANRKRQRTPKDFSCSLCGGKSFKRLSLFFAFSPFFSCLFCSNHQRKNRKENLVNHWKTMHRARHQSSKCPYEGCGRTRFDTPDALPVHCWQVHGLSVYDTTTPGCTEPGCEELRFESLTRLWEHMDTVHRLPIERPDFLARPVDGEEEEDEERPRFYRGAFYPPIPLSLTPMNTRPALVNKRHKPDDSPPPSSPGKDKEELYDYDEDE
jgi:hypothetical protein